MSVAFLKFPPQTRDMGGFPGHVTQPPESKNMAKFFSDFSIFFVGYPFQDISIIWKSVLHDHFIHLNIEKVRFSALCYFQVFQFFLVSLL
jgi:hypothetical protein